MIMTRIAAAVSGSVVALLVSTAAQAAVFVDSANYVGSRATVGTTGSGGGLQWNPAAGIWSDGGFKISWDITNNGTDYTYKYTLDTPLSGSAKLSHWLLELSPTDANGNSLESYWESVFVTKTQGNYTDIGIGPIAANEVGPATGATNVGMPSSLWGVKFTRDTDLTQTVVQFTTTQAPVWGDFYARDGGGTGAGTIYAYNLGFGTDPTAGTTNFLDWIARPDGDSSVLPEPGSLALFSLVLTGWGAGTFRAKQKKAASERDLQQAA